MPYTQTTLAQLRALLLDRLGNAGSAFFRVAELNFYINEGLRLFGLMTGFWKTRATLTTAANTTWYALPASITSSLRVTWQDFPLSPISIFDLDFGRVAWRSETIASGGDVPTRPKHFAVGALNLIAIWPGDTGSNAMEVDGLAATPFLALDTDKVDLGQDEVKILLDYCQYVAAFKQGGLEAKNAQELLKRFLKAAAERSGILREASIYRSYMGLDKGRWQKRQIPEEVPQGGMR